MQAKRPASLVAYREITEHLSRHRQLVYVSVATMRFLTSPLLPLRILIFIREHLASLANPAVLLVQIVQSALPVTALSIESIAKQRSSAIASQDIMTIFFSSPA